MIGLKTVKRLCPNAYAIIRNSAEGANGVNLILSLRIWTLLESISREPYRIPSYVNSVARYEAQLANLVRRDQQRQACTDLNELLLDEARLARRIATKVMCVCGKCVPEKMPIERSLWWKRRYINEIPYGLEKRRAKYNPLRVAAKFNLIDCARRLLINA